MSRATSAPVGIVFKATSHRLAAVGGSQTPSCGGVSYYATKCSFKTILKYSCSYATIKTM